MEQAGGKLLGSDTAVILREREAKLGPDGKKAVLVMQSGNVSEEDIALYKRSGIELVIAKPLPSQDEMYGRICDLLRRHFD